ncbi:MAG: porin [Bacteroides sp.]|nr:porin [Bacteroides sp.]
MDIKRLLVATLFCTCLGAASAADEPDVNYLPNIHGTVRARWEMTTDDGESRFEVRNARLQIDGKIASWIDYFFNSDLCDQGKMKVLDYWGRITPARGFTLRAGQFRMPFGVDPFRAPDKYFFSNRSYIGKQVCNIRGVGAEIGYTLPTTPLTVKVAAFNPGGIADHAQWHSSMAYAGKLTYRVGNVTLATGVQSLLPQAVRINLLDGAATWTCGRWTVEGEYMNKHYTHSAHKTCHAYNFFTAYTAPLRDCRFNQWSLEGRFDGMTDHSAGTSGNGSLLTTDDPARNRVTLGGTLSYIAGQRHLDLRLDYEHIFFRHDYKEANQGSRLVAELILHF